MDSAAWSEFSWNWSKVDCCVASAKSQMVCLNGLTHRRNNLDDKNGFVIPTPKYTPSKDPDLLILMLYLFVMVFRLWFYESSLRQSLWFLGWTIRTPENVFILQNELKNLNESRICDPRIRNFEDSSHFGRVTTGGRWNCSEWGNRIKHFIVQLMHTSYKILRLLNWLKL